MILRSLFGPGGSSILSHRNGIARMWSDTATSSGYSIARVSWVAVPPTGHRSEISKGQVPDESNDVPTWWRKIEPRWFPPPGKAPPS
jgi:hypothetical protein